MVVVRKDGGEAGWPDGPEGLSDEGLLRRSVVALAKPKKEAKRILTDEQYWDLTGLVKRLEEFGNQQAMSDLDIRPFRQFWELRVKGGFIRNLNLRVYFAYLEEQNEVVILMAYKKEEDRRVSPHIHTILEDRLEDYLLGLARGASVHLRHNCQRSDP
ncbi:MAG TPA: hypothetical protein VJ739_04325 [Gemmataceae bacterium]|nr:hypothetical protein [Gemmataceae bacterium]